MYINTLIEILKKSNFKFHILKKQSNPKVYSTLSLGACKISFPSYHKYLTHPLVCFSTSALHSKILNSSSELEQLSETISVDNLVTLNKNFEN